MNNVLRAAYCKNSGVSGRSSLLHVLYFTPSKAVIVTQSITFLFWSLLTLSPTWRLAKYESVDKSR